MGTNDKCFKYLAKARKYTRCTYAERFLLLAYRQHNNKVSKTTMLANTNLCNYDITEVFLYMMSQFDF